MASLRTSFYWQQPHMAQILGSCIHAVAETARRVPPDLFPPSFARGIMKRLGKKIDPSEHIDWDQLQMALNDFDKIALNARVPLSML
jgi:hypothetical protein